MYVEEHIGYFRLALFLHMYFSELKAHPPSLRPLASSIKVDP